MAQWPTSVATDANLYIAVNELQTNLAVGIGTSDTTLNLNSTTSFPTVGLILIDNEIIQYTGISGNNLTGCTRAFDGTTAASHSTAAIVSFAIPAAHHNVLKDEIKALETYLSNNLGLTAQPLATGNRVLLSSAGGKITESSVTNTTLGFLDATSSIQTQLNAKAPTASPTFTGTIGTALTVSRVVTTDGSGNLATGAATMGGALAMGASKITGLANGSAATDAAAFGQLKVLQTVLATSSTVFTTTSGSFQSTSLTVNITPTSSSNRVLILVCGILGFTGAANDVAAALFNGVTDIANIAEAYAGVALTNMLIPCSLCYIDSPASTSQQTYTVKILGDGTHSAQWGDTGKLQVIIAMEVV